MADNKKYYYMRLKENFFDTDEMVYLESLEEGFLFSNILLKLYLRSLKNEGLLMMNSIVPYDAKMISRFTNHSLSTVEKALFEFQKLGLIEKLDSGQMYMSNIELFVGKTTTEADRKRLGRMKAEQKLLPVNDENEENGQMSDKCPPELELELELELEREREKKEIVSLDDTYPYERIIDYLNRRVGSRFDWKGKEVQSLIKARFKEGAKAEDFKIVIDKKWKQWHNDAKMVKYLRPKTLFAKSKFNEYLGEAELLDDNKIKKTYEKVSAAQEMLNKLKGENVNEINRPEFNQLVIPENVGSF